MKISVLVPSERYLETAGVRVRYKRIMAPLAEIGWTLDVKTIDVVPDLSVDGSRILIFSKCQDARALVLATAAKRAGIAVGVDLFDDYFSQGSDPRFASQRLWLGSMAQQAKFFLCSTPRMLDVGNSYFQADAGHVLTDPHEAFDPARLQQELAVKIRKAKRERSIPILWFGIAGNPNFPVGLHDLSTFGDALRPFHDNSYKANLTILTNRQGIDGRVLERLRRIPVPFTILEWTKKREEEALARSLVSFLPVNFQQFSIAKSLNRGVSALVGGTQLLTAGYPLYGNLDPYVYKDAASLIDDLENSTLKLSSDGLPEFSDWIGQQAAPATEALGLVEFLKTKVGAKSLESDHEQPCAVLHGIKSSAAVNSFAQRLDWLSLASPLTAGGMMCDGHLGLFGNDPVLRLRVSQAGLEQLPQELRIAALWADDTLGKGPPWEVPLSSLELNSPLEAIRTLVGPGTFVDAAINTEVLRLAKEFFASIFENLAIIGSELDPIPNIICTLERT